MAGKTKTAVVYFSLSGHSRRVAEQLCASLDGNLIALQTKYRLGILGYLRAGFDSLMQREAVIGTDLSELGSVDQLVICGPVWTSYPAAPLREVLRRAATLPTSVALFLTCGDQSMATKAFAMAREDLGRELAATAALENKREGSPEAGSIIAKFLNDLKQT